MESENNKTSWFLSILVSLVVSPILSGILGWIASLITSKAEGASGFAFMYVMLISMPIIFVILIFIFKSILFKC